MDLKVSLSQITETQVSNEQQQQPIRIVVGSARNFKGVPEAVNYYIRPLMIDAHTQVEPRDFKVLNEVILIDRQSQREKDLEEEIKALKENIKAHTELLSQIHATNARSTELLGQQQARNQAYAHNSFPNQCNPNIIPNNDLNSTNILNNCSVSFDSAQHSVSSFNTSRSSQFSPKIVNGINGTQQVNSSYAESVKYRIIAENTGHNNEEPIEIQLAEEDGALNLNSSADSGRLEICLGTEENVENAEIKTELNASQPYQAPTNSPPSISNEHQHLIKKRKMAAAEYKSPSTEKSYENEESLKSSQQSKNELRLYTRSSNSLLKTPVTQNRNIYISTETPATPIQTLNSSYCSPPPVTSSDTENLMISIGPNNTSIPAKLYENMNWSSASIATRKLLMAVFDRHVLATHSMTGKPSPAFKDHNKPVKKMLDPLKIADIIFAVTHKCNVSDKEVRNAITTKCADENKMMKLQMNKRTPMREINKENFHT